MRRLFVVALVLLTLVVSTRAFAQTTYATVSGRIEDASRALIPGVTITATNNATGVVTSVVSNESGTYNFPSLLPGSYRISAMLPGFRTQTYTDVQLGSAAQVRLDFTMTVSSVNTAVEVTVAADTLLSTSSSSVGEVLSQQRIQDLPTVSNNVLDLFRLLPGVRMNADGVNGTFAGMNAVNVNMQRDGVDASGSAYWVQAGVQSATFITPELIGEVRMILAPVDAEVGRGNGQVQFMTRSGTNRYTGSLVWSARNTALDANTWNNNNDIDARTGQWKPTRLDWLNSHQYTASIGGPILKNKTFFFALFDGVIVNGRTTQNPMVLTPCARNGIFRYYDNWNNGNPISTPTPTGGTTPTIAVVNLLGQPQRPATNPNGSTFTGTLRHVSVFGPLANVPTQPDCSDAVVQGGPFDANRRALDPTGFVTKVVSKMPQPNNYEIGDGLNTAGFRWLRNERGGTESIFSTGGNLGRKQINTKIDHNFNSSNKIGVSYTYERSVGNQSFETWPDGFRGSVARYPQTLSVNFTSTLSPTLLNEARVGLRRTQGNSYNGFNTPKDSGQEALGFYPNIGGYPVFVGLGTGAANFQTTLLTSTSAYNDTTSLWSFGDSISWTRGQHAFKMGGELRRGHSQGYDAGIGTTSIPRALGGDAPGAPIPAGAVTSTNVPGLAGTAAAGNNAAMRNLMSFMAGSLASVAQFRFIQDPQKLDKFEDYLTYPQRYRELHYQNESSLFFKDDWKVLKTLTLNLGMRWDYFAVPYEGHGLMPLPIGGSERIWGISGSSFADWMKPGVRGEVTSIEFVGKNSPNPDKTWYPNDWSNFGPAVGFAWQIPWFGEGKTTLRGGYQITYQINQSGNNIVQENNVPGTSDQTAYVGDSVNPYLDLTKLPAVVPTPLPAGIAPMRPIPITARTAQIYNPDPGISTPYAQNLTMSLTHAVRSNVTVDLRYVGTLARKQWNPIVNINIPNFLYNGLKEAFDSARAGGESTLLDQMFNGINLGAGRVGQNGFTGAAALRADTRFNSNLANGNYLGLATTLNTLNYVNTPTIPNPALPAVPAGVNGSVLRNSGLFPENFIVANPQFGAINMLTTQSSNNYHSMEAQVTVRPTLGVSVQSTYTWSKNLGAGVPGALGPVFTNVTDRHADYAILPDTRIHDFRTNGTFELPIGPNKLLLDNSSGVLARAIEGWQMSWIVNLNSGAPLNPGAQSMLYANGTPDVVAPIDLKAGRVLFAGGSANGNYFPEGALVTDRDPQCLTVTTVQNLRNLCTLNAIKDAGTGRFILQNPLPGKRGSLGLATMEGPGIWRFDANLKKSFRISESKTVQVRLDATNILNHPEPATPNTNINSATTAFGAITGANAKSTLHRQFQGQLRLTF
jgi:hypothetical protein